MNDKTGIPQYELLIDGKWVPPESGKYSTILNPATEEVIAHVAAGSEKDVDIAAKAARAALKVWNGISAAERGRILNRLADLLEKNQEELIALESMNAGKPIASVRRQDMPAAIDTLRYYAGWTDKIIGQVIPARTDALTYTVREPVGVVGAIVPWNFPIMIGIWKIAPALACGCTLIVKPAELTPMTAIRIGELALEAGIPPGVLNIVTGKGSVVGDAMVAHPHARQDHLYRLAEGRSRHHAGSCRQFQENHSGTGWQIREYHLRRCRSGQRDPRIGIGHFLQCRTGMFRRFPDSGPQENP